ncbi:MAG: hypothetical protein JW913_03920 [Chitinispirillaceae bacterium]|nr:hypothetical protein [Chitinispirillaceae bacterium]
MKCKLNNERGFAVVYGLVILLLASVGGTALLFMTQKDRIQATDYAKMRSSSQAAIAALKACEGQFQTAPDVVLDILKDYIDDPDTKRWLLGTAENATEEQKITLGSGADAPQYSARIVGYNENDQLIMIEGTGYLNNGGKKKAIAAYQLGGLMMVTPPAAVIVGGRNGLYIARDGESFNWPMTITGDVYFGGTFIMQSPTRPVTINGNLKTGITNTSPQAIQSQLTVNGNAYFQSPVCFQNSSSKITGKAGFEKNVTLNQNVIVEGDSVFSNAGASGSGKIAMQAGKTLLHSGSFPSGNLSGGTLKPNGGTINDMATRLGMCSGNESPVTIDISQIPANKRISYATVFGATWKELTAGPMNTYYQNHSSDLWNNYLVIDATGASPQWNANPGTFNHKVIWLLLSNTYFNPIYNSPTDNKILYNSGTGTGCCSIFYITGNSQIAPCVWSGTLRGYFYVAGSGNELIKLYNYNQTLIGGINVPSSGNDPFELTGPTTGSNVMKINYEESVIQELVDIGLATWPTLTCGGGGGGGGGGDPELKLVDLKIRPMLVSMQL